MKIPFQKAYHSLSKLLAGKKLHVIRSLVFLNRQLRLSTERLDYIRISSLELAAEEIYRQQLSGSVAELGVYQGDFAKDINQVFPDKIFYLFDTFTGFNEKDVAKEIKQGYSEGKQDFSATNVDLVVSKMPFPANCRIKKGYFPETAKGLEEAYCFVSIDTDLYEPVLAGLNYFYPRLIPGGYIFVHDYNNAYYPGAAEAVKQFCKINKCSFVPVADIGGTAIITK